MSTPSTFITNDQNEVLCLQCADRKADFVFTDGQSKKPFCKVCWPSKEKEGTPIESFLSNNPDTVLIKETELENRMKERKR